MGNRPGNSLLLEVREGPWGFAASLFIDGFKTLEQEFKAWEMKTNNEPKWSVTEIYHDLQNKRGSSGRRGLFI